MKLMCKKSRWALFLATVFGSLQISLSQGQESVDTGFASIICDVRKEPPAWALYERQLIDTLNRAGIEFYDTYVLKDGSLEWKERYEGGMNSSDDAYEAFRGFSLLTALGGAEEIDRRHRKVWEGITKQFTRYGQIYREFDSNWDWMHHGEGYISLYPMGMVKPNDEVFRDRAVRFAAMYTGEDPESPNWDPEHKIIRSVMNGSRGPKMEWVKRDWIPTNGNLTYYPLPYFDIPGVEESTAWINDHPDNDQFGKLVKVLSDRMAKGDVPINLAATALIANAYLYTGEKKYVQWVKDYVGTWERLTRENGGITPDNVGLSGKAGEYTGYWWGGYYGWVWPRGGTDIVYATLTSAKVATLLSGDKRYADLPRSQMAVMRKEGRLEDGRYVMPIRHDQRGWYHYSAEIAYPYVNLWYLYHNEDDWSHIERLAEAELKRNGRIDDPDLGWAYFVRGRNPDYPLEAFQRDFRFVAEKMVTIRNENGDPETWVDNKWINHDPVRMDNLVRLTIGAMPIHKRGEMLHAQVRYFDPENKRAGLPSDVAALVSRIEEDWIQIEVSNVNQFERRQLVIQGGTYGEHQIKSIQIVDSSEELIDAKALTLDLGPGAGFSVKLMLDRYINKPSYQFPWN
jgi:hypothetical protein